MKPVRIVGRPHFNRPFLHTCGNLVGYAAVQRSSVVNHIRQFGIHLARQIAEHLLLVEYILGKYSDGRSAGTATATGFFLNAVSTTLNLNFDIIP